MSIKTGDLVASAPSKLPTMVSDGRRLRILWQPEHGNGEPSGHLVDRCVGTIKGHPTWKLFCGTVPHPIVRDESEPPYNVYLDDLACHTIWTSQHYTKEELRTFWPFDFDYLGKIQARRPNRGRPAYLDDTCTEFAKGTCCVKKKTYIFRGGLMDLKDMPAHPGTATVGDGALPTPNGLPRPTSVNEHDENPESLAPFRTTTALNARGIPTEGTASRRYSSGPNDGNFLPMGIVRRSIQGLPYFEDSRTTNTGNIRISGRDMSATTSKMKKRKAPEMTRTVKTVKKRTVNVEERGDVTHKRDDLDEDDWDDENVDLST